MILDLSSQIVLDRVSSKYYKPDTEYDISVLCRLEKIPTQIFKSSTKASSEIARKIANKICEKQIKGEKFVFVLPSGNSSQTIYRELIRMHEQEKVSFNNVVVFTVFEFYPLSNDSVSNLYQLKETFLNHVDILPENIHSPNGTISKANILNHCKEYEFDIDNCGGIDFILLDIGCSGSIGLNMPGSSLNSKTHLVLLDNQFQKDAINSFGTIETVPASAITMGLSTIMNAREIALIAWGEDKSESVKRILEEVFCDAVPASCLQQHPNANVYLDLNAAFNLTRISKPWLITNCDWNNKLIRRAIVWLCQKLDKPILKLTNKDYQDHGLGELLAIYGAAYNVNIKIFNDLQHTITGWPGGKPDSDDTNRPERARPYPKRIIIFSPHPDDDVISMGGTFKRLVDQSHEVYLTYQTSGNIAVSDEEVVKYVSLMNGVISKYNPENQFLKEKFSSVIKFLLNDKKTTDSDTEDILYLKGQIRRQEATIACRFVGLVDENITFLDLPFYETGNVKKKPLAKEDVEIVKNHLNKICPNQIFVAGDLADPHGTHKVCLDAVLAAIDDLKKENCDWLEKCRIWMYRGAWAEWEIDYIEMAVPISPEELHIKRNSILKHQSQMEGAPFLGDDERLFWQRSEERNKATAELYKQLGLASYEAIEAFVEYKPL